MMWIVTGLPMVTAVLAVVCALWRPARSWVWPLLGVAALNLVLTPFTSGEWFYQRTELPDYKQAVATGDFTGFRDLLDRHDPYLQEKMTGIAVGLLVSVAMLAVLEFRARRGTPVSRGVSGAIAGVVILMAFAAGAEVVHLGTHVMPAISAG